MRKLSPSLLLTMLLLACGPGTPAPDAGPADGGVGDLPAEPPDLSLGPIQAGALGAACSTSMDCTRVPKNATCFRSTLLNLPGEEPTPGGYCSADCARDADCGYLGRCIALDDFGLSSPACFARCNAPGQCRVGYACLLSQSICVPAARFTCDPTQGTGSCMAQVEADPMKPKVPGGCLRETYERLGRCAPQCTLGVASCPVDPIEKTTQHCVYLDTTVTLELKPTLDKWKGLVCQHDSLPATLDGQPCTTFEQCLEGSQCDLWPGGSRRCYPQCVAGGMPRCATGATCQDQLRAGPGGVGLCK